MQRDQVPAHALDACKTCGAEVIWTVTGKNRRMMVDLAPGAPGANLVLTVVAGEVHSRVSKPHLAFGNPTLHMSHFVKCPQASTHRTRRRSHAERRLP